MPHPRAHIVYPYTDENLVEQAVSLFATAGIRDGEGVILIMTADHWEPFRLRLKMEGVNVEAYERSGRLFCATTEALLKELVEDEVLNEARFKSTIADLIRRVRASASDGQEQASVRIFGEMVSQLRSTNLVATTRLEELWNEVIQEHSVALLCTYALHNTDDHLPTCLMQLHSHNIERNGFTPR